MNTVSPKPLIGFHFATHYNGDQGNRNAANRCVCEHTMQQNATGGRGSALNNVGVTARLPQIL